MRVLVIDDNYPAPDNLYGDVFAHVRVKEYLNAFPQTVVAACLSRQKDDYNHEGVDVRCVKSIKGLVSLVESYHPDIILIHFATFPIIKEVIFRFNVPFIIWVHGFEALAWYRRLFNFKSLRNFLAYVKGNVIQLFYFRKLIKRSNETGKIHFVFVSEWMKRVAETDCLTRIRNYSIIPNPINDKVFSFKEKSDEHRLKLLMIRPFESKKYGTDIVTEAMIFLKRKEIFDKLFVTVYGKGSTKSKMFQLFGTCPNVSINEGFLTHNQVKELHDAHGVFLALTRQDAQGVSMCEAMSSGLVVISSYNTAIPEFVTHNFSGLLTDNRAHTLAKMIEELVMNPDKFKTISRCASSEIIKKAGIKSVVENEIKLISSFARSQ
jgi:glycosyltransferase involved in cell wall biosynthesis